MRKALFLFSWLTAERVLDAMVEEREKKLFPVDKGSAS